MVKKSVLVFSVVLISFLAGYVLSHSCQQSNRLPTTSEALQQLPECEAGRCPRYLDQPWYAFGESEGASVVIVPVGMTKGAGQVWIIRSSKVAYKTPELPEINAWIDGQNLYISYTAEFTPDMAASSKMETDKLVYRDEAYQLVKVSTGIISD